MLKHGHAKKGSQHPLYTMWQNMCQRCLQPSNIYYLSYGGRGIYIDINWRTYEGFYSWAINNGYKKGLWLDRRDVDGNYNPLNCRFVDKHTSDCNQRLIPKHNTSGYRGVSFDKRDKLWYAYISVNNEKRHLGTFKSPKLAALRYDVEALLLNDGRPMNIIDRA